MQHLKTFMFKTFTFTFMFMLCSLLVRAKDADSVKYPIVLINGWGGSSLDGTSTSETEKYVSTKCATEFEDKRIWISLNTVLNFVHDCTHITHTHTLQALYTHYTHAHVSLC